MPGVMIETANETAAPVNANRAVKFFLKVYPAPVKPAARPLQNRRPGSPGNKNKE